jgi:hypothetical protein
VTVHLVIAKVEVEAAETLNHGSHIIFSSR